ncbi:hypothetical protein CRENPOLYSF1_200080 [Crenothrix polyspora]|uniref:Uncharacterized protein n=1 Tax=Crenothrix polyspora TaxID=360316 RepID=A0A1R4H658_9GAMM|nr:hypothetical protein CRENPOLYSF1_200080 [Crenothrix polyspora]
MCISSRSATTSALKACTWVLSRAKASLCSGFTVLFTTVGTTCVAAAIAGGCSLCTTATDGGIKRETYTLKGKLTAQVISIILNKFIV